MNLYGLNPYLPDPENEDRSITALAMAANGGGAPDAPIADAQPYDPGPPQTYDTPQLRAPDMSQMAPKLDNMRALGASSGAPSTGDTQSAAGGGDAPGVSGWALAADILLNKGRGLGGIIAQADKQRQDFDREQRQRQAQALERKDHEEQNRLGWRNTELRGDEIALSRDRAKSAADEEKTKLDMLQHPENYPLTHAEQLRKDEIEAMKGERGVDNQRADAQLEESKRHNLAAEGNDRARTEAMAGAQARADAAQARADAAAERAAEKDQLLHSDMPGLEITDREAWKAATLSAGERGKSTADVAASLGLDRALGDAEKIRKENGSELFGDKKAAYEAAMSKAVGSLAQLGKTGVVSEKENARYRDILPSIMPGASDAYDAAVNGLSRFGLADGGHDTKLDQLRAVREELKGIMQNSFTARGARIVFDGDKPVVVAAPSDDAPPSARNAMPQVRPLSTSTQLQDPSPEELKKRYGRFGISFQ